MEFLHCRYAYDASGDLNKAFLMHPVQLSRDVQAAFANFASQRFHLDVQSLAANGMQAMRLEEPDDFRMNGFGNGMPGKSRDALSLCADDVQ